jgi:membrane-associated protease RseP (regulator of RpoE activity)
VDLGQLMATLYNSFVPLAGMIFAREASIQIDTSLLPPGEVIEKYFDAVVMVMEDRRIEGGRVLSLRSASSLGLSPVFLAGAGAMTYYLLAPAPPPGKGPVEIPRMPERGMEPPPKDGAFMGILFEGNDPPPPGIYITGIIEGTPAEEIGLLEGDVLLEIDGKGIAVLPDISSAMRGRRPGDIIEIVFLRGGERLSASLILGRRGDFVDE